MEQEKIFELVEFLKELRDQKDELDDKLKALNAEIESVQNEVIDYMVEHESTSINHKGFNFSLVIREFPSAEQERKSELYEALKERGYEGLFTVNSQTLSATVKELMQNNDNILPDWLEGLVKIAEKASIRISKGRRV